MSNKRRRLAPTTETQEQIFKLSSGQAALPVAQEIARACPTFVIDIAQIVALYAAKHTINQLAKFFDEEMLERDTPLTFQLTKPLTFYQAAIYEWNHRDVSVAFEIRFNPSETEDENENENRLFKSHTNPTGVGHIDAPVIMLPDTPISTGVGPRPRGTKIPGPWRTYTLKTNVTSLMTWYQRPKTVGAIKRLMDIAPYYICGKRANPSGHLALFLAAYKLDNEAFSIVETVIDGRVVSIDLS